MQNSFSLVPPIDSAWCTNAQYEPTVAGIGSVLIFNTWSTCQSCFLSFHTSTPGVLLCNSWNTPSRLSCVQSFRTAFRAHTEDANDCVHNEQ